MYRELTKDKKKSNAREHYAKLFSCIKLLFVFKTFVLYILSRHVRQVSLFSSQGSSTVCAWRTGQLIKYIFTEVHGQLEGFKDPSYPYHLAKSMSNLGLFGRSLYVHSNCKRSFCKLTVETPIRARRRVLWPLVWVCTVYLCPIKRTIGLLELTLIAAATPTCLYSLT